MTILLTILFLIFVLTLLAIGLCVQEYWERWDYNKNRAYYEHKYEEYLREHYKEIEPFVIDTINRHVPAKKKAKE